MTDYTKTTDFTAKDSLPSGDASKLVKGSEIDDEFDAIATAVATKVDNADFATTTLTFSAVPVQADSTAQNWAHGLGTDDIDFGFTFTHGTAGQPITSVSVLAMSASGYIIMSYEATLPSDPDTLAEKPASGNIRVNVHNSNGVYTPTVTVRMWARKRA